MNGSEETPKKEHKPTWLETHYNNMNPATKIKAIFITITVLFTLVLILYAAGYNTNKHRINDLQASRISSCQTTYSAFIKVFAPFLPTDEEQAKMSQKQKDRLNRFFNKINELVLGCSKQVELNTEDTKTTGDS